jgi:hypothetical protein
MGMLSDSSIGMLIRSGSSPTQIQALLPDVKFCFMPESTGSYRSGALERRQNPDKRDKIVAVLQELRPRTRAEVVWMGLFASGAGLAGCALA